MLQDVIHPPEHLPNIDDVSSPLSAQILELCGPEFLETLQNSDVTSSSTCNCYEDNSSYTNTNLQLPPDIDSFNCSQDNTGKTNTTTTNSTTATSTTTTGANTSNLDGLNTSNLSILFGSQDDLDNELSASIDFSSSPSLPVPPQFITGHQDQFDFSSLQPQLFLSDVISADAHSSQYSVDPVIQLMGPPLTSVFEDDCLSSVPSYAPLNPSQPSCTLLGPAMSTYMPAGAMTSGLPADSPGFFATSILMGSDLQPHDLDYQGDNVGIYCPDPIQRLFSPGELQALSSDTQQLVGGAGSSTPLASEMSSLEDSSFKVGKLSVEQRKEKIHRYMKKRNERNFSKKIKYACRKTLADSRPRVRGRFAKNDDFGETPRAGSSNHEEDDDDEVPAKGEDEMVDSADIFAHISGVNSFKCNYPIQSWI